MTAPAFNLVDIEPIGQHGEPCVTALQRGLYEALVDRALQDRLAELGDELVADRVPLSAWDAPDRLALHVGRLFKRAVASLGSAGRVELGARLARDVIRVLQQAQGSSVDADDQLLDDAQLLRALLTHLPDGRLESLGQPDTPLLDTTLLTNAPGEPRIGHQIESEIESADRIDILMAFVRRTGIRPLVESLRKHCARDRQLRLLTTIYTGSTELAALEQLQALGADIRVSYDTSGTRLHAKAWLFHRVSGYSTAYIGSSNLTHSAQVTGLEWNVRVAAARNPDVIDKFSAVFTAHWESDDFVPFDAVEFRARTQFADGGPRTFISPVELRPEPFQSRLLEQIALARIQGHHRNLLVSAPGTGKTVMAALDYQHLRDRLPRSRLLFVAHRREILEQSLATFRQALRDGAFGELWVSAHHPRQFEHVFASVQSLSAAGLQDLEPDHFDVVIVDEFHHAAARTYEALLSHVIPRELLGLTATPERADNESILHWFDGRIAAELRLWDAIEQQRLCPFQYFGISAGPEADLRNVRWHRGRGYDVNELDGVLTGNDILARRVIHQTIDAVADPLKMRALGFCVSIAHAHFMAEQFRAAHIPAVAVSAGTNEGERAAALRELAIGELNVVFAVDLFNEGVDIPTVDTLLLLRPTDSATVFLQQLGRGLRKSQGKDVCTVLDFVCQHRKEFQFRNRLGALLGGTRRRLIKEVEQGFPRLPSGCHMELDRVASDIILENLRNSLPTTWNAKAQELQRVAEGCDDVTLARFLVETGMELEDIYSGNHSWSDLLVAGGIALREPGPLEAQLRRAIGRLLHIDDVERIAFYSRVARADAIPQTNSIPAREERLLHMLVASLLTDSDLNGLDTLGDAIQLIWQHPQVIAELGELMQVLKDRITHVHVPLADTCDVPLMIHARYTRREILAALVNGDATSLPTWREGVRWFPDRRIDVAVVTLDKSGDRFSPTTRYRDYAINRERFHWESQSFIRETSPTGMRYQQPGTGDSTFLLFVRMTPDDRAFWFLGPAAYVSHESERPMAITWRLEHALPGDLFAQFAAAM